MSKYKEQKEINTEIVKRLIKKGEVFMAQVCCNDWRLSYNKIMKELLEETKK